MASRDTYEETRKQFYDLLGKSSSGGDRDEPLDGYFNDHDLADYSDENYE